MNGIVLQIDNTTPALTDRDLGKRQGNKRVLRQRGEVPTEMTHVDTTGNKEEKTQETETSETKKKIAKPSEL